MARRSYVVVFLVLMLAALCLAGAAEELVPATPTDLECAHEHTKTTIYFFDSPVYTSVSDASHRVSGPAAVEVVCLDCGAILSADNVGSAEEIRPHSMKKGVCALCGYRTRVRELPNQPDDLPGERTIFAQEDENADGLLTLKLTGTDLTALERANITTVLVRGKTGIAAIALKVPEVRVQTEKDGTYLYMELAEREDGSFFAGLFLVKEPGDRVAPEDNGISLRFYQETKSNVRVSLSPVDTDRLVETEGIWDEHGYWSVPYLQEGTYFFLQ